MRFEFHVYRHLDHEAEEKIALILERQELIMAGINDFREAQARFSTALQGVRGDITRLLELLQNATGGLSATDTAEATEIVGGMAASLEALDAENPPA